VWCLAAVVVLFTLVGFVGSWFWVFDLFANFRPQLLAASLMVTVTAVVLAKRDQSAREADGDIDPLFRRRRDLTFATGVKYNDDFLVYEEIINELHEAGQHVRGIRLRVLVGELMNAETTAFWDRYGWTPAAQADALRREITAFLPARSAVVTDTSGPW